MYDSKIIEILRSRKRDKALVRLYKYYPNVKKLIRSKGGDHEDAQDIYQEALILFCKKVADTKFVLSSSIDTYLYGVCRFLWKNKMKKKNQGKLVEFDTELKSTDEEELQRALDKEKKMKMTEEILDNLGDRCWEILRLFYHDALKMKEIAEKMGFKSEKIAKNQKYKCLERAKLNLKEQLSQKPIV